MRLIHGVPGWGSPLLGPQLPRGPPQLSAACRCGNSLRGKRETSVALSASFPLPLEALLRDPSGSFLGPDSRIAVPEPCSGSPAGSICFRILLGVVCHLLQAGLDGAVGWSPRQLACPETLLPPGPRVRTSPGQGYSGPRSHGRSEQSPGAANSGHRQLCSGAEAVISGPENSCPEACPHGRAVVFPRGPSWLWAPAHTFPLRSLGTKTGGGVAGRRLYLAGLVPPGFGPRHSQPERAVPEASAAPSRNHARAQSHEEELWPES